MVTPLMKILIAVILLYLLITVFFKFTKWTLRAVIVLLIIGIFVFGYTSVSEILNEPPQEKIKDKLEKNKTEDNLTEQLDKNLEELDELEKDMAEPPVSKDDIVDESLAEGVPTEEQGETANPGA